MKPPKDAYKGNPNINGGQCGNGIRSVIHVSQRLTPMQHNWMQKNKPLYYTGRFEDISHIPRELRFA